MNKFETAIEPVSIDEYNYYIEELVREEDLAEDGLYYFMLLYHQCGREQAAKCLSRISKTTIDDNLPSLVDFYLLQRDQSPFTYLLANINLGLVKVKEADLRPKPTNGYFRNVYHFELNDIFEALAETEIDLIPA